MTVKYNKVPNIEANTIPLWFQPLMEASYQVHKRQIVI